MSAILWLQLLKLVELEGIWAIIKFHSVVWAIRKLRHRDRDLPRFLVSSKRQIWLTEGEKNFLRGHWATGRHTGKAEDKAWKIKDQKWFAVTKAVSEILSQNLYVEGFNAGDCALHLVLPPLLTSLPLQRPLERGRCYCCFASTFRLDSPHPVLWVTSSRLMCVLRAPDWWAQIRGLRPSELLSFLWEGPTPPFCKAYVMGRRGVRRWEAKPNKTQTVTYDRNTPS